MCALRSAYRDDDDEDEDDGGSNADGGDAVSLCPAAARQRLGAAQECVRHRSVNLIHPEIQRLRGLTHTQGY